MSRTVLLGSTLAALVTISGTAFAAQESIVAPAAPAAVPRATCAA